MKNYIRISNKIHLFRRMYFNATIFFLLYALPYIFSRSSTYFDMRTIIIKKGLVFSEAKLFQNHLQAERRLQKIDEIDLKNKIFRKDWTRAQLLERVVSLRPNSSSKKRQLHLKRYSKTLKLFSEFTWKSKFLVPETSETKKVC